jgi:hypothetical protein
VSASVLVNRTAGPSQGPSCTFLAGSTWSIRWASSCNCSSPPPACSSLCGGSSTSKSTARCHCHVGPDLDGIAMAYSYSGALGWHRNISRFGSSKSCPRRICVELPHLAQVMRGAGEATGQEASFIRSTHASRSTRGMCVGLGIGGQVGVRPLSQASEAHLETR